MGNVSLFGHCSKVRRRTENRSHCWLGMVDDEEPTECKVWAGVGFVPLAVGLLLRLATTVVSMLVASAIGAWLYEKVELS